MPADALTAARWCESFLMPAVGLEYSSGVMHERWLSRWTVPCHACIRVAEKGSETHSGVTKSLMVCLPTETAAFTQVLQWQRRTSLDLQYLVLL